MAIIASGMLAVSITFSEFGHAHSTSSSPPPAIIARYKLPDDLVATTNALTDPMTGLPNEVFSKKTGHVMCLIPPGVFLMGAPASSQTDDDESPCHPVFVSACYLSKGPVSNLEFEKHQPQHRHGRGKYSKRDAGPATRLSWEEAREFCDWMSQGAGLTPGSDDCYRLATEAEAERSARGGLEQELYPWGSAIDPAEKAMCTSEQAPDCDQGCVNGLGFRHSTSAVFYWLRDYYDAGYYSPKVGGNQINPTGPWKPTSRRCLRGQTWYVYGMSFRCSDRWNALADTVDDHVGLRVLRALPAPADLPVWTGRPSKTSPSSATSRLTATATSASGSFCIESAFRALQERARAVGAPLFTWPAGVAGDPGEDPANGFYCPDLTSDPGGAGSNLVTALSAALADEGFLGRFVEVRGSSVVSLSTRELPVVDGITASNYVAKFQVLVGYLPQLKRTLVYGSFTNASHILANSLPLYPSCQAAKDGAYAMWDSTSWLGPGTGSKVDVLTTVIVNWPDNRPPGVLIPPPPPPTWRAVLVASQGQPTMNLTEVSGTTAIYMVAATAADGLAGGPALPSGLTADGQFHEFESVAGGQVWVGPHMGGEKPVFSEDCPIPVLGGLVLLAQGHTIGAPARVADASIAEDFSADCPDCAGKPVIVFTDPITHTPITNLVACVGITNTVECKVTLTDGSTAVTDGNVDLNIDPTSLALFTNNQTTITVPLNNLGLAATALVAQNGGSGNVYATGMNLKDANAAALPDSNTTNITLNIVDADLDADTDRDETVDKAQDEEGENAFTKDRGAVITVNNDDDDKDGKADNTNSIVEQGDVSDLAPLIVRKPGATFDATTMRMKLRIAKKIADGIRIFEGRAVGSQEVLGKSAGTAAGNDKEYLIPNAKLTAGDIEFSAESLWQIGTTNTVFNFKGDLKVTLVVEQQQNGNWVSVGSDEAQFQVAPMVAAWNGQNAEKIYANGAIADDLKKLFGKPLVEKVGAGIFTENFWAQDYMEIVNHNRSAAANTRIPVLIDLQDADDGGVPADIVKGEPIYGNLKIGNDGNGGDIETTPPLPGAPLGLVYGGSKSGPIGTFFEKQRVQIKGASAISITTRWLVVQHVDEIISFLPTGSSHVLAVPSPRTAVDILDGLFKGGQGNARMLLPFFENAGLFNRPQQITVDKLLVADDGKAVTQLGAAAAAADTILTLNTAAFAKDDILRVDDEYLKVTAVGVLGGKPVVRVERAVIDDNLKPAANHANEALIYALSDLLAQNLHRRTATAPAVQRLIDDEIKGFIGKLGTSPQQIELPVLFIYEEGGDSAGWAAFTSNLVNCLVANGQVVMPETYGPITGRGPASVNHFESDATIKLTVAGVAAPTFIDAWKLHLNHGEVHCGSNARREPLRLDWWVAWPQ